MVSLLTWIPMSHLLKSFGPRLILQIKAVARVFEATAC